MCPNSLSQASPDFTNLYIFGAGGHGREVAWLAKQRWPTGVDIKFLVDKDYCVDTTVNDLEVELLETVNFSDRARFVVALGDPNLRRDVAEAFHDRGAVAATIVHPQAAISSFVDLGPGVVVCAGNVITTNVQIEQHVHVNVSCTIAHDVVIGEFATLSPGVHIAGNVHIGKRVFVGIGAIIINGREGSPLVIGDGAIVAAGACVTRSVAAGALVAGVPAVRKR